MAAPLIDQMLTHAIYFERYKNHEAEQLIRVLDTANVHCRDIISKSKSVHTKTRYLDIMKEIKGIRDEAVEKIDKQLTLDLNELVGSEINHQSRIIKSIGIDLEIIKPAPHKVFTAATFMPFASSQTFESTLRQLGDGMYEQWDMAVRTGYLTGETAREINRRVLGSVKDQLPGTMKKIRNSFDSNTKTMLSHYAEHARDAVYEANSDIIIGYRRLETLDGRTCLECGLADGNTYKTLKEAPPLPSHLRCRGLYLPLLRGIDNYDGERAAKDGPVSAKTDWKEWFEKQPVELQKDILGPQRYELYKKGAPLGGFVPDGRKITLKQWQNIDGNIAKYGSPVAAKTQRLEYKPASTVKEAEQWAKDNLDLRFVKYGKIPVEVVNEWQQGIADNITRFPALKNSIKDIGTNQELRRNFIEKYVDDCLKDQQKIDRLVKYGFTTREEQEKLFRKWGGQRAGKTPSRVLATSYADPGYREGIGINEKWAKDPVAFRKTLAENVKSGFHPPGCNTLKSIVDHEMGHEIDKLLNRVSQSKEFDKIINGVDIRSELSVYPVTQKTVSSLKSEVLAEAWAEYLNNDKPRPLALKIAQLIEQTYSELFGGTI